MVAMSMVPRVCRNRLARPEALALHRSMKHGPRQMPKPRVRVNERDHSAEDEVRPTTERQKGGQYNPIVRREGSCHQVVGA